jgi:hypothetical protein
MLCTADNPDVGKSVSNHSVDKNPDEYPLMKQTLLLALGAIELVHNKIHPAHHHRTGTFSTLTAVAVIGIKWQTINLITDGAT